jgi:polysaccharide export outer membrane protein
MIFVPCLQLLRSSPLLLIGGLLIWAGLAGIAIRPSEAIKMPGGSATPEDLVRPNPQPLPGNPASQPLAPQPPEEPYVLGPADRVQVVIFQVPQYSGEYEVQLDGRLNLQIVGPVMVEGLTVEEATALISSLYGDYLRRPIVTLNVTRRRTLEVGIAGEVNSPGSYSLSGDGAAYPTLRQLLQSAGGITPSADLRNIQIRRKG